MNFKHFIIQNFIIKQILKLKTKKTFFFDQTDNHNHEMFSFVTSPSKNFNTTLPCVTSFNCNNKNYSF